MTSHYERNEQAGTLMLHDQDKHEQGRRSLDVEREEMQQAAQRLIRSTFRFGVSLAFLSVNRLPRGPRRRFQATGSDFTCNLASFIHTIAEDLEEIAQNTSPSPTREEDPHPHRASE